ncbi:hypothetical protein LUZ60_007461 [Juncus effusus]|nr:hypothetical protein LUZ60_007461 [Juncus effusus]
MRAVGCTVEQALTSEAATVVKQSLNLARRRGHAQATPLHVASTMLSSGGLLREACQQTHSHPLQCKALDLCFNVALNRLPASASVLTTHQTSYRHNQNFPTLSNALIAAFKRAQAHQRRGSVESQHQPLVVVKIELQQLIISILDDPSVSRVMREAGFSSAQVKNHVEKAVSVELTSNPNLNQKGSIGNKRKEASAVQGINKVMSQVRSEDVIRVLDCFSTGDNRCVVVVGDCESTSQSVIRVLMDKIARGEVSEGLKNTQLIPLSLSSFQVLTFEEVESKVLELKTLVKNCSLRQRGVLFVLEDFKLVCEEWEKICMEKSGERNNNGHYSSFEHVMMEVRSLINGDFWSEKAWLLGFCTSQSYMRCKSGRPSLETLWCLHSVHISDGGLGLSLNCESEMQILKKGKGNIANGGSCCSCIEASGETDINGDENQRACYSDQGSFQWKELCKKKQNSIYNISDIFRNQAASDLTLNVSLIRTNPNFDLHNKSWRDHHLSFSEANDVNEQHTVPSHHSNSTPNYHTNPNPSSSSSGGKTDNEYRPKFKELNAANLKALCNALEKNVLCHKAIMPEIASTMLRCRSGMTQKKERSRVSSGAREDTWFFFRGTDSHGKEKIARELANLVFGSYNHFLSIGFDEFCPSAQFGMTDDTISKRSKVNRDYGYLERVFEALRNDPHRVIFLKDVDRLDYDCRIGILSGINCGRMRSSSGEEVGVDDAILVLSHEDRRKDSIFGLDLNLNVCEENIMYEDGLMEAVDLVVLLEIKQNL